MLFSHIWPSLVKYGIVSNNRHSKLRAVMDAVSNSDRKPYFVISCWQTSDNKYLPWAFCMPEVKWKHTKVEVFVWKVSKGRTFQSNTKHAPRWGKKFIFTLNNQWKSWCSKAKRSFEGSVSTKGLLYRQQKHVPAIYLQKVIVTCVRQSFLWPVLILVIRIFR